jgi:hypothetical protein
MSGTRLDPDTITEIDLRDVRLEPDLTAEIDR